MQPSFGKIAWGVLAPLFGAGLSLYSTDAGNPVPMRAQHWPSRALRTKPLRVFMAVDLLLQIGLLRMWLTQELRSCHARDWQIERPPVTNSGTPGLATTSVQSKHLRATVVCVFTLLQRAHLTRWPSLLVKLQTDFTMRQAKRLRCLRRLNAQRVQRGPASPGKNRSNYGEGNCLISAMSCSCCRYSERVFASHRTTAAFSSSVLPM